MGQRLLSALVAGVLLALLPFKGFSQPEGEAMLVISPEDEQYQAGLYNFQDYLNVFVDSTEGRPIEEVAAPAFQPRFTREERWRAGTFGGDLGPDIHYLWARLRILSQLEVDEEWLINIDAGEVDLFYSTDSSHFAHQRSGSTLPIRERAFKGSYGMLPCMPLRLPSQDTLTVYFRLKGAGSVGGPRGTFNNAIFKPQAYMAVDRRIRFFDALMVGIMLAVSIYHLIIFLYQRKYVSLFFGLFVLSYSQIIMEFRGYGHEILLSGYHLRNGIILVPITVFAVNLFHYGFSRLYLKLPKLLPVWDKIWGGLILLDMVTAAMVVKMVLDAGEFSNVGPAPFFRLVSWRVIVGTLLKVVILIAAIMAWTKGNKAAKIYLIAMLFFLLPELIWDNSWFGLPPIPAFFYGYFGQTLMVLLFAAGIARQLKSLQEEKMTAEQAELTERAEANRIRELDVFKSRFYTNITHQFRTPLTIILGMASQIRAQPTTWLNKGPEMILRNGRRLLHLIDQILNLSRLEAGQLPTHFVQGDVVRYIKYIVESFHSAAEHKNIRVQFETEQPELVMDYDPDKLMDILSNLISNAIKFTQEGGVVELNVERRMSNVERQETAVESLAHPSSEFLQITVADNGPGISEEALPRIFERFYSLPPIPSKGGGAGIGLALTQELVHLLHGEISVKSELGKGTTFTVTLPITHSAPAGPEYDQSAIHEAVSAYAPRPEVTHKQDGQPARAGLATVLLVEDNPDVVEYIRAVLSPRFQFEAEYNGKKGLARARQLIPDIIISDIMMPEMDGLEMCQRLKTDKRTSHIPIILLTAKADRDSKIEGLRTGADAYLAKPFDPKELLVRMDKLIELRAQLQERYRDIRFFFQPKPSLRETDTSPDDHFMRELLGEIEANLSDQDFSIAHLCRKLGMSRTQLYKKVKALAGHSVADIIRKVRLHKARQLLQTTHLNITQVSIDVGFKNLATFSRSFTEEFGLNPSDARKL